MNTVSLNSYRNTEYRPGPLWKRTLWFFCNALVLKNPLNTSYALKVKTLRAFGAKVGRGVKIKPCVSVKYPWFLTIGDHTWIGEGTWIDNVVEVVISHDVCISQGAMLLCGNHDYTKPAFNLTARPITLEEGTWVGAKAVVCPGVTLHSHSVLSVGSVATRSLEAYGIYQGNPAVKVRERVIR